MSVLLTFNNSPTIEMLEFSYYFSLIFIHSKLYVHKEKQRTVISQICYHNSARTSVLLYLLFTFECMGKWVYSVFLLKFFRVCVDIWTLYSYVFQ